MIILQQAKYTIHKSNQKYFENTQINLGVVFRLGFSLAQGNGDGLARRSVTREAGRGPRCRAGSGGASSGELRRTSTTMVNSGNNDERESARK
jgi:hypothetical protein